MRAARVLGGRALLLRRDEADEVLRHARPLSGVGLVGDDRQTRVDLHRVGDDDLGAEPLREAERHLGLAERSGTEESDHRRGLSHRPRRSPRGTRRRARPRGSE